MHEKFDKKSEWKKAAWYRLIWWKVLQLITISLVRDKNLISSYYRQAKVNASSHRLREGAKEIRQDEIGIRHG